MKLLWIYSDPFWELALPSFIDPLVFLLAIVLELYLAIELLFNLNASVLYTAFSAHAIFLGVGLASIFTGQSCHCFGRFANFYYEPILVVINSALLLGYFLRLRSNYERKFLHRTMSKFGLSTPTCIGLFAGLFIFLTVNTTTDGKSWAGLNSAIVVAEQATELNSVRPGETCDFQVRITNLGDQPIKITGAMRSCQCLTVSEFPFAVPARGTTHFQAKIKISDSAPAGDFIQGIVFYVEGGQQTSVGTRIEGNVADL